MDSIALTVSVGTIVWAVSDKQRELLELLHVMRGGMDVLIDLVHRLLTFGKNIAPLFHDAQAPIKLAIHAESRAKPVPASGTHECRYGAINILPSFTFILARSQFISKTS